MHTLPGLCFLKAYPPNELWRLVVDGQLWHQEEGWRGYEARESGSIHAALESLCLSALEVDEDFELSIDFIQRIHKRCGKNVHELADKNPGQLRTIHSVSFGIPGNRASIKGIEEFLGFSFLKENKASFGLGKQGCFLPEFTNNYFVDFPSKEIPQLAQEIYHDMMERGPNVGHYFFLGIRQNVDTVLKDITHSYNRAIKAVKTIDEKLYVIAYHIRQYEILHPFLDTNGRTFVNNLLNILLMQQGLPPATFYEPNVFDLYSTAELVTVIKDAIFNTIYIIENHSKTLSLYGYDSRQGKNTEFDPKKEVDTAYHQLLKIDFKKDFFDECLAKTKACIASLENEYPLHRYAVYVSDSGAVNELMLRDSSDINLRISQGAPPLYVGKTPLHLAIMANNKLMIKMLIEKRADFLLKDFEGKTPLHYAAIYNNLELIEQILAMPAYQQYDLLNAKDSMGKTALHYAVEFGYLDLFKIIKKVTNIDLSLLDNEGYSLIVLAYKKNQREILNDLLASELTTSNELLNEVIRQRDNIFFKKIIDRYEALLLNPVAFEYALYLNDTDLITRFLDKHIDINIKFERRVTPLIIAVLNGHVALVETLLKRGADIELIGGSGVMPLNCIFSCNNIDDKKKIVEIFLKTDPACINKAIGEDAYPIFKAVMFNDIEMFKFLLEKGANITVQDRQGNNILYQMIKSDRVSVGLIKETILDHKVFIHQLNHNQQHPFHAALFELKFINKDAKREMRYREILDLFLEARVNLNIIDNNHHTLLDTALCSGVYDIAKRLLENNAETNISAPLAFLTHLTQEDILSKNSENLKQELIDRLDAKYPVRALTQLNDLYLKLSQNSVRVPAGFSSQRHGLSFFLSLNARDVQAHKKVLLILKTLYKSKLKELINNNHHNMQKSPFFDSIFSDGSLQAFIESQAIAKKIQKSLHLPTKLNENNQTDLTMMNKRKKP
jgi:ankyrin repeat protein